MYKFYSKVIKKAIQRIYFYNYNYSYKKHMPCDILIKLLQALIFDDKIKHGYWNKLIEVQIGYYKTKGETIHIDIAINNLLDLKSKLWT